MRYVSIDLETTGLNPDTCQILELGVVIDDLESPLDKLPHFRYKVKEPNYRGEPRGLAMNWRLLNELSTHKHTTLLQPYNDMVGPEIQLTCKVAAWLKENQIDPKRFLAAGKNFSNFDARFLRKVYAGDRLQWRHRVLDPGSMYVQDTDIEVPSTGVCILRSGIDITQIPGKPHTIIHDALVVCALIRQGIRREEQLNE